MMIIMMIIIIIIIIIIILMMMIINFVRIKSKWFVALSKVMLLPTLLFTNSTLPDPLTSPLTSTSPPYSSSLQLNDHI